MDRRLAERRGLDRESTGVVLDVGERVLVETVSFAELGVIEHIDNFGVTLAPENFRIFNTTARSLIDGSGLDSMPRPGRLLIPLHAIVSVSTWVAPMPTWFAPMPE